MKDPEDRSGTAHIFRGKGMQHGRKPFGQAQDTAVVKRQRTFIIGYILLFLPESLLAECLHFFCTLAGHSAIGGRTPRVKYRCSPVWFPVHSTCSNFKSVCSECMLSPKQALIYCPESSVFSGRVNSQQNTESACERADRTGEGSFFCEVLIRTKPEWDSAKGIKGGKHFLEKIHPCFWRGGMRDISKRNPIDFFCFFS